MRVIECFFFFKCTCGKKPEMIVCKAYVLCVCLCMSMYLFIIYIIYKLPGRKRNTVLYNDNEVTDDFFPLNAPIFYIKHINCQNNYLIFKIYCVEITIKYALLRFLCFF